MIVDVKADITIAGPRASFRTHDTLITPDYAREILAAENWTRQRDVNWRWVADLTAAIQTGQLTFLSLVFAELPDGSRHLVDGQHRLNALSGLDLSLPASVITHRVKDDADLGKLYLKYDRARARGPEVGLKAMGILEQSGDVPPGFVRRMSGGVHIIQGGFSRSYRQNKDLVARSLATGAWMGEITAFYAAISGAPAEVKYKLQRAPVAAVALVTFRHQEGLAEEFWSRLASQEMLGTDDPRRRLMIWLRSNVVTSMGSDILYCRYVATAWNAWFEHRDLKIIKVMDSDAPVRIAGTTVGR